MKPVTAALVIQHCPAGEFHRNVESTLSIAASAADRGARIVVFPEMNLTGYVSGKTVSQIARRLPDDLIERFSQFCSRRRISLLTGMARRLENGQISASHLVFTPDGYAGFYRKIHAAPFEKEHFTTGSRIPVFKSHNLIYGIQLCYDAHFPELSTAMALKKADIIFLPHASPRGTPEEKKQSWLRHLRARAFDNGLYIAACNQVGDNGQGLRFPGVSLLIGPDGNVISKKQSHTEQIHMVDLDPALLSAVRSHKMRYFLPNRRSDLF